MNTEQPDELNQYWRKQVDSWEASGLSQIAFCEKHDLTYHRFTYWKTKFLGSQRSASSTRSGFVKVKAAGNTLQTASSLSLTLPNGMVLRGLATSNLHLVRQLVEQWL